MGLNCLKALDIKKKKLFCIGLIEFYSNHPKKKVQPTHLDTSFIYITFDLYCKL